MYSSITTPTAETSNQHQTAFPKKAAVSASVLAPKANYKDSFLFPKPTSIFSSNGNISSIKLNSYDTIDHNKNQFTYGAYNCNNKFNTTSKTNIIAANTKMYVEKY